MCPLPPHTLIHLFAFTVLVNVSFKISASWAGEMAYLLRALAAHADDQGSVPRTQKAAHDCLKL